MLFPAFPGCGLLVAVGGGGGCPSPFLALGPVGAVPCLSWQWAEAGAAPSPCGLVGSVGVVPLGSSVGPFAGRGGGGGARPSPFIPGVLCVWYPALPYCGPLVVVVGGRPSPVLVQPRMLSGSGLLPALAGWVVPCPP